MGSSNERILVRLSHVRDTLLKNKALKNEVLGVHKDKLVTESPAGAPLVLTEQKALPFSTCPVSQ